MNNLNCVTVSGCSRNDFHKRKFVLVSLPKIQQIGSISGDRSANRYVDNSRDFVSESVHPFEHESTDLSVVQSMWNIKQ